MIAADKILFRSPAIAYSKRLDTFEKHHHQMVTGSDDSYLTRRRCYPRMSPQLRVLIGRLILMDAA